MPQGLGVFVSSSVNNDAISLIQRLDSLPFNVIVVVLNEALV